MLVGSQYVDLIGERDFVVFYRKLVNQYRSKSEVDGESEKVSILSTFKL